MEKITKFLHRIGRKNLAIIGGGFVLFLFILAVATSLNSQPKKTNSDIGTVSVAQKQEQSESDKKAAEEAAKKKAEEDAKRLAEAEEKSKAIAEAETKAAAERSAKQKEADLLAEAEKWIDVIAWCDDWSSSYHDDYGDLAKGLTTMEKLRKQYYQPMLQALAKIGGSIDDLNMEVALEGTDFYKKAYGKTYYHTCWLKNKELNDVARKNNLW